VEKYEFMLTPAIAPPMVGACNLNTSTAFSFSFSHTQRCVL